MASDEYWTEKTVSWKTVVAGFAIWIFAFAALLLVEAVNYVTAEIEKTDDFIVQREKTEISDILTGKEYHLRKCTYCE